MSSLDNGTSGTGRDERQHGTATSRAMGVTWSGAVPRRTRMMTRTMATTSAASLHPRIVPAQPVSGDRLPAR